MNGNDAIFAMILGEIQDAGLPHIGCRCPRCTSGQLGYAASMAVVDGRDEKAAVFLLDATPDIKYQLDQLADWLGPHSNRPFRFNPPDAIFLTHAHLGHIGGLPQFGPEAMAVSGLPVYASEALIGLLQATKLWAPAVAQFNLRTLRADHPVTLAPGLTLTPVPVPHRDELKVGTFAFLLQGPRKSLLYLPDIDDWRAWDKASDVLASVDTAVVDACFFSPDELAGRPPMAHPFILDTLEYFAGWPGELVLTHINHTNPVLTVGSEAATAVHRAGARVAGQGLTFPL